VSLRELAAADLKLILEDTEAFGWPITVTSPAGVTAALVGYSNDIALTIDPETGIAVSGRSASVALAMASLTAAGLGLPRAIADVNSAPWLVTFNDIGGAAHTFKVSESHPDRAIGCITCTLEAYR
jgi:hypothetical protein